MIVLVFLFTMLSTLSPTSTPLESELGIITTSTNHLYHFSNKDGSFFVGETKGTTRHFLMGYISYRERLFSDYTFQIDGIPLDRVQNSTYSVVYPWSFQRHYPGGKMEELIQPDYLDAFGIRLVTPNTKSVTFTLFLDQAKEIISIDTLSSPHRVVVSMGHSINTHLTVAIEGKLESAHLNGGDLLLQTKMKKSNQVLVNREQLFSIGMGSSSRESQRNSILLMTNFTSIKTQKRARQEALLSKHAFVSNLPDLNKAYQWALLSFDALNMNEIKTKLGPGIYAGYPWFQDYWGRDSFIALRGLIASGQYALAKKNLMAFVKFQIQDSTNSDYGKIPNRVRPDESIYNTADATPRFIIEANRYYQYTRDKTFKDEVAPYIQHAIWGSLAYRVDSLGLLTHEDADTWMDAKGPKGPYSPRGNRANDIQALWIQALESTLPLTQHLEDSSFTTTVSEALTKAKKSFYEHFIKAESPSVIADAISEDSSPSSEIRLNQLFTLPVIDDPDVVKRSIHQVMTELATPYGVLSLSPQDSSFHPFHKVEPFYEQDASYHNGLIWVWNSGELVAQVTRIGLPDKVFPIIENYAEMILSDVTLGTLPELLDAMPRPGTFGEHYPDSAQFVSISRIDQMSLRNAANVDQSTIPPQSGTFSQAWSLSEWLRNIREDFLGFHYEPELGMIWMPTLPEKIEDFTFFHPLFETILEGSFKKLSTGYFATLTSEQPLDAPLWYVDRQNGTAYKLPEDRPLKLTLQKINDVVTIKQSTELIKGIPLPFPLTNVSPESDFAQSLEFLDTSSINLKGRTYTTQLDGQTNAEN